MQTPASSSWKADSIANVSRAGSSKLAGVGVVNITNKIGATPAATDPNEDLGNPKYNEAL